MGQGRSRLRTPQFLAACLSALVLLFHTPGADGSRTQARCGPIELQLDSVTAQDSTEAVARRQFATEAVAMRRRLQATALWVARAARLMLAMQGRYEAGVILSPVRWTAPPRSSRSVVRSPETVIASFAAMPPYPQSLAEDLIPAAMRASEFCASANHLLADLRSQSLGWDTLKIELADASLKLRLAMQALDRLPFGGAPQTLEFASPWEQPDSLEQVLLSQSGATAEEIEDVLSWLGSGHLSLRFGPELDGDAVDRMMLLPNPTPTDRGQEGTRRRTLVSNGTAGGVRNSAERGGGPAKVFDLAGRQCGTAAWRPDGRWCTGPMPPGVYFVRTGTKSSPHLVVTR